MIYLSHDNIRFEYDPNIRVIMIDLFAGAGGVTHGVENARVNGQKVCRVIAAVNHDRLAIESHMANHPDTYHFIEDIKTIDISKLQKVVDAARVAYPNARLIIWASLECTNFSNAKGGLPREADSRTLANHLFRYLVLNPDGVFIENVKEFMSWGPLDENGKPISKLKGRDYMRWLRRMQGHGFNFEKRMVNSANLGAFTSRERYFAQFLRKDLSVSWPETTHTRKAQGTMFGQLEKWKAVREVLDLQDEGKSIFNRKKPLVNATHERIYAGLIKFIANGDESFISKYYSGKPEHKNISIDGPAATIKTVDGQALVKAVFIQKYNSMAKNGDMKHTVASIDKPCPVVTTQVRLNLVQAFMMQYHGKGQTLSLDGPASTLTTKDRLAVIRTQFLDKQYGSGKHNIQSIEDPAGTLLGIPKLNLVSAVPAKSSAKHHYLVNPQFNSKGSSIDKPCFTLIARMDKRPPSLISCNEGHPNMTINDDDSEIMVKIKTFMMHYGIVDIRMRMLKISELLPIMGFPQNYILKGPETTRKKFIGNAVETTTARRLIETFVHANSLEKTAVA